MLSSTFIASRVSALCLERGVTLRYCNESGSRAWGLESTDSDYDVRFIYQHPKEWYLQLGSPRDMIGPLMELDGELDMAGWDLRKVLLHVAKSNPGVLEWLHSPATYIVDEGFLTELRALATTYFNPHRVVAHYLGIARSAKLAGYEENTGTWNVKKYCYYMRPTLAAHYVATRLKIPPVAFNGLLDLVGNDEVVERVNDLVARKATVTESHREAIEPTLETYFEEVNAAAGQLRDDMVSKKRDFGSMDDFFRQTIGYR